MSIFKIALAGSCLLFQAQLAMAQIQFSNVTDSSGPFGTGESWGSSWGDFNADGYPDLVLSNHREVAGFYLNAGDGTFSGQVANVDASNVWRSRPDDDTHGFTWADFDNDGDQDLFGAASENVEAQLLLNENNQLNLVSRERNLFDDHRGRMGIWFDYTNDGLLDMAIPTDGYYMYQQDATNPGSFIRDTSSGLHCTNFNNYGLLIDTNDDGRLDFLCGREGAFPQKAYDVTTRPFTDITKRFPTVYNVNDTAIGDFNGDLLNDMVVTRGRMRPNKATVVNPRRVEAWLDSGYNSKRGFSFKSTGAITVNSSVHLIRSGSNIFLGAAGQHPSSKRFTVSPSQAQGMPKIAARGLYIGYNNAKSEWSIIMQPGSDMRGYFMIDAVDAVSQLKMINAGGGDKPMKPMLVLNNPGKFQIVKNGSGFIEETCVSVASGDFDNDTDIDVYMACRNGPENVANVLYENLGNAKFVRVANAGGATGSLGKGLGSGAGVAESVTVADYDADGFLDLFVTNGLLMRPLGSGGKHELFRNAGNSNHWVEIDLEGMGEGHTNRDGIGAKVYVTANNKTQLREQNGGYHRWSQNHQRLHFGLADAAVLSLSIEWPSGKVQSFDNLASNTIYKVLESGRIETVFNPIPVVLPKVSVQDVTTLEMDAAQVSVNLSEPYPNEVTVAYSLVAGSATEGADFVAQSGVIVFAANQTAQIIDIALLGDNDIESEESLSLVLSAAVNAEIETGEAVITIIDDDLEPELSINDVIVNSGDDVIFTLELSAAYQNRVTLDFNVVDGRAVSGVDYRGRDGSVTFEPGEKYQAVALPTMIDPNQNSVTDFTIGLSNILNAQATKVSGYAKIASNKEALCGRPSNLPSGSPVLAVYTLCDSPDIWYFEGLANGSTTGVLFDFQVDSRDGVIAMDQYFFEEMDSLLATSSASIAANMRVIRSGYDIFSLTTTPAAQLCLSIAMPADTAVVDNAGTAIAAGSDGRYDITANGACL